MTPVELVTRRIERALARLAPPSRLLVACSGGPDSRTLLEVLHALAPALGLQLNVAAVDHGLRPESAAEAARVVELARSLGLDGVALRVNVPRPTMEAARHGRYRALVAHARAIGAGDAVAIVVGHTATDQAETLLDRMIRGAGTRGLSAMAPSRLLEPGLRLLRPMLEVSAAEVAAYVDARGLEVARDPTNHDLHYRRSRLRHEVLPLLRRERADLDHALAALCTRLRADADALDAEAGRVHALLAFADGTLDARGLAALSPALAARVILRSAELPVGEVHIGAVLRLCADLRGTRAIDLPSGFVAERRYERLAFRRAAPDPGDQLIEVRGPGRYRFLTGEVELTPPRLDAARAPGASLWLRNVRPGDRLRLGDRSPKVQDVMVDAKVPRPDRRRLPMLVRRHASGAEEVLWIPALTREGAVQ